MSQEAHCQVTPPLPNEDEGSVTPALEEGSVTPPIKEEPEEAFNWDFLFPVARAVFVETPLCTIF